MNRKIEQAYPYFVPTLIAVAFWYWHVPVPKGEEFLSASITVGAIFTGFLATSKSILIGLQSENFDRFKKTKFFPILVSYLRQAIFISLMYCGICLAGFAWADKCFPDWYQAVWVWFTTATFLSFYRVTQVTLNLIA